MLMDAREGFRPLSPYRLTQMSSVEPSYGVLKIDHKFVIHTVRGTSSYGVRRNCQILVRIMSGY
jgi:hypothetical protein